MTQTMWNELKKTVEQLSDESYRNADYTEVSAFIAVLARMESIERDRKQHQRTTNYENISDWYLIHLYNEYGKIFAEYDKRMKSNEFIKELAEYQKAHSKE